MIVNQRWGFSAIIAAVVGVGVGILIAVLAGLGSGSRLIIGIGVGLLIGGALLAIFDRVIVRPLTRPRPGSPAYDPETGEPLHRDATSTLLGWSLEVWTLILVGFGILVVGVGVVMYLARV